MWSAQLAICGQRSGQAISWGQRQARAAQKRAASVENRAPSHGGEGSGGVLPLRATTTATDSRCSRRRSAGGDDGTTLFRSVRSDEDGGNQANIAASGSEQSNSGSRAAVLRRSERRRSFLCERRQSRRLPGAIRRERQRAIKHCAMREQLQIKGRVGSQA